MEHHDRQTPPLSQSSAPAASEPSVEIDFEAYLPYLEDEDIPDDQKMEMIEMLFAIMRSFCDLGFGIHPVQHDCGKVEKSSRLSPPDSGNALNSASRSLVSKFEVSNRERERSEIGGGDV